MTLRHAFFALAPTLVVALLVGTAAEDGDKAARANLAANKVNLVDPTPDDRKRAQAIMRPMWDAWAKKHGAVGQQLLDGAMKACGAS